MKYFPIILLTIFALVTNVHSLPKGGKGGGGVKSGVKAVVKAVSSSKSKSSSSKYYTTPKPYNPSYQTTSTTTTTQRTTTPITRSKYYQNIRDTYCHAGSEDAVTCPGSGFTLQLLSALTDKTVNDSATFTLQNNATIISSNVTDAINASDNITSTATPLETSSATTPTEILSSSTTTPIANATIDLGLSPSSNTTSILNSTSSPPPQEQSMNPSVKEKVHKVCQSVNTTCFQKMHTFVNECLVSADNNRSTPFGDAYQFDLHIAEDICAKNSTVHIGKRFSALVQKFGCNEWAKGLDTCLPYFTKGGETLRKAVSECKMRPEPENKDLIIISGGDKKISLTWENGRPKLTTTNNTDTEESIPDKVREANNILACVRDTIKAPGCTANCTLGTAGCTPFTLARNKYLDNVFNLLEAFQERSSLPE